MLLSSIPAKFPVAFASGAGVGFITTPIPLASQPNGRASLSTGFSTLNFDPLASGGIPPWGADFNGLLYEITSWLQWTQAGGQFQYDASFQTSIGGYPKYALIQNAAGDRYWLSTVDNNLTNPDAGGAGWIAFPDVIVQKQAGNFAYDNGTPNSYNITLTPQPASIAAIVGAPVRVMIGSGAGANTVVNPTIHVNAASGSTSAVMINSNGSPLIIGQLARAGQIFEGIFDGSGFFQIMSPAPIVGGSSGALTGVIYEWSSETPPSWGLECDGSLKLISSYPNLFNVIGFRYGGNGVDQMRVPDKRGAFTRGWDHGRGLDPDASTRLATVSGTAIAGDHVGSWQLSGIGPFSFAGALNNPRVAWASGYYNQISPRVNFVANNKPLCVPQWFLLEGMTGGGPDGQSANVLKTLAPTGMPNEDWDGDSLTGGFPSFYSAQQGAMFMPIIETSTSGLGQQADFAATASALTGTLNSTNTGAGDTRGVNINMMYVIAF